MTLDLEERRDLLPGLEPDRRVTDWGRSERVEGVVDRYVWDFFYHLWFRCEVEGIDNIPTEGGAMIVSNHSGVVPPDAPMIGKAIREEHPRSRPLHITVEHFFKGYPGFSMILPKIGCVPAHPANVRRLLADEEELVLVFPEGNKGTTKLYKDRYRLRRFGRGGFVRTAMQAKVPIVPVALVGAEEALPAFAQIPLLARLTGLLYAPLAPPFPLPAKFLIRFLDPIRTDDVDDRAHQDSALVQTVAQDIRARIQEELWDMVGKRHSVWLG